MCKWVPVAAGYLVHGPRSWFFQGSDTWSKKKSQAPFSVDKTIRLTFWYQSCYGKHENTALSCIKSA